MSASDKQSGAVEVLTVPFHYGHHKKHMVHLAGVIGK
jgi:hypothetical protein